MTSPLALVPSAHQVVMAIELLMKRTLPSAIMQLTPPGWLLVAFSYWPNAKPQPPQLNRQPPQGYCVEFGGTIVLNDEYAWRPTAQRYPLSL